MPNVSISQASWWSDARQAMKRLAKQGRYPATQNDLKNEIDAVRAEAAARRETAALQRRMSRLESDDEYDPYR